MQFQANALLHSLAHAWIQTPDLDRAIALCHEAIGLAVIDEGRVDEHWATPRRDARWVLLGDPDETAGRLCLIEGEARADQDGLPRGLDSVEIVVGDVDVVAARIDAAPGTRRLGQTFDADLTELGGNQHRSALWHMPWGTHFIITAGLTATPGRDFPSTGRMAGRVFEVHVRTDSHADGLRFYADALGMPALMTAHLDRGPIHQAWGLAEGTTVDMDLLKTGPEGTGLGAVELQGHAAETLQAGARGGTAGLTFEAGDLPAVHTALTDAGYRPTPIAPCPAGPSAGVPGFTVRGVEGEPIEIIEARTTA